MLVPGHIPAIDDSTISTIKSAVSIFLRRVPSHQLNMDRDDLIQELIMYVIDKMDAYQPSLGTWPAFVNCIVKRKLSAIRRSLKSPRHRMNVEARSFEQCDEECRQLNRDYVRTAEEATSPRTSSQEHRTESLIWETKVDVLRVLEHLAPDQRLFCAHLEQHHSREESYTSMGISRSNFYRRLKEVKQVFIEAEVTRTK